VPYLFLTIVIGNKDNTDIRYTRPSGMYWDKLIELGLSTGIKTTPTIDRIVPVPVIDKGVSVNKVLRTTPFTASPISAGVMTMGRAAGARPTPPAAAAFPTRTKKSRPPAMVSCSTSKCTYANLDVPTWSDPLCQLMNAGVQTEEPRVYLGGRQHLSSQDC
jgi:hypothetical protein